MIFRLKSDVHWFTFIDQNVFYQVQVVSVPKKL